MTIDQRADQAEALLTEPMTPEVLAEAMRIKPRYARLILNRLHRQRRVRPAGAIRQRGTCGLHAMRWERWTR